MSQATATTSRLQRAAHWVRKELLPLLVLLVLMTAARSSFANHYQVPSGSMQPTLEPGDRVVVDMHAYGWRLPLSNRILVDGDRPQRGEVVVFDSPRDGTRLIKRVVAVAGDRVDLIDGHLQINHKPLAVEGGDAERFGAHLAQLNLGNGGGPNIAGLTVQPGKLLMLGDHRGNSLDGRYFGLVDAAAVYGKAVAVYYRRGEGLEWQRL
ncbi:signal peptidase I [Xanthomonas arboricola]|uniref:signal peptidase I n=1 Tax=Xanthomonas arboricola TaxID=56448 RepID=UPI0007EC563B|nr:signal peptidase I [Xanthomonas arboricola]NIK31272.1 signal peptidase I [Xanthomonas arboricola]OBR76913.1 signal peptidase I [Xanthomonas arboricola]PPT54619.1 signal peptidase I [Xanthomonas arboricola]